VFKAYLFDWGNTLMVDFPSAQGPMCDWPTVEIIEGAKETLNALSQTAKIYIATGAANSNELAIQTAFQRVGLDTFISGYFCEANLGIAKGTHLFMNTIINKLGLEAQSVAMVGDSFEKDIQPAVDVGMAAFWLTNDGLITVPTIPDNVRVIRSLTELL